MGMEMDSLDLIIESQVKNLGQINEVYNALGKVAVALNRTSTANRTAAREAGKMVAAFRALANIKLPDFATFASQLQALSRINLNNLQKTVGVKVELDAPGSAKQIEYALGKAVDAARIDSQSILAAAT